MLSHSLTRLLLSLRFSRIPRPQLRHLALTIDWPSHFEQSTYRAMLSLKILQQQCSLRKLIGQFLEAFR
ncbi:hypothetical protein GQ57_04130 [Burkholderia sp. MSh2]|nr:hypothetical protein GQ57_04130 [Burkholderia sp. MSh2]